MQISAHVQLSTLLAAQSAKAAPPQKPAAQAFEVEVAPPEKPAFEPLLLAKAEAQKPEVQAPVPPQGGMRLGGQIDIKI